jgi:cytochrome c-type biogenesis protein CcsB
MPVDEGLAQLSDTLFGVATAVYAVGMLGYAAEFSFSRFGRAGASHSADASPAEAAALVAERRPVLVTSGAASGMPDPADPAAATTVGVDPSEPTKARLVGRVAVGLTVVGWMAHVASVITRGIAADRAPWGNMYEFSSAICLIAVTAFLVLLVRQPVRWLGVFVMLPAVLYLGFAGTVLYVPAGPLVPALNSYWLKIHVVAAIISSGIFLVSAVTTVLYLVKDRWETRLAEVAAGRAETTAAMRNRGGIVMRLPSAVTLDTLTYRTVALAFPIWTFAVVAGAIWAEAAWGRYWGWDPKETWSFITWVVYAAYLHARATGGWKGRRAAAISLVGFSALFVDYYLVNLVISGLHSYAGVSV